MEIKLKSSINIKEDLIEQATATLNSEQLEAFYKILDFLRDPEREWFVVEGYAGTGKTYMLSKIIQIIDGKVAMTAPTNKAVKVLAENRNAVGDEVIFSTIHRLLALRLEWVYPPKGSDEEPYQRLVKKKNDDTTIREYKVLVIDECSMLDDELLIMIKNEKPKELKVIFMGDPAQIPPVNRPDSIPLIKKSRDEWNMLHVELTKNMRQASDNEILQTAYQIRNNRFSKDDPILDRLSNKDVHFYSSLSRQDKIEFIELMLYLFDSDRFKADANFVKAIAWTNKVVDVLNSLIRSHLYKGQKLAKVMIGEKLIADEPIMDKSLENIKFNTSDEFTVLETNIQWMHYKLPKPFEYSQISLSDELEPAKAAKEYSFKYYECIVEGIDPVTKYKYKESVDILHEDSIQPYTWALSKLKQQKNWRERTKLISRFAHVKYNYAITAHKAQGSTYGVVFLMEDDIDQNFKNLERNRIKYTSATRPKYQLHILTKHATYRNVQRNILSESNGHDKEWLERIFG